LEEGVVYTWILDVFILIVLALLFYRTMPAYAAKKGENKADKEDSGKIAYEQEHGKNLATKDDIDSVIKELEKVKSEVSLAEQRRHNLIEKRNENLLGIVEAAERMRLMKIQLSTVINNCDADTLKKLKQDINEILVSIRINVQFVTALTEDEKELIPLNIYSYDIVQTGIKYMEFVTNAISLIGVYEDYIIKAQSAQTAAKCKQWGDKANETFDKIQEYSDQTINFVVSDYHKHEELYIKFLNASYRKGNLVG